MLVMRSLLFDGLHWGALGALGILGKLGTLGALVKNLTVPPLFLILGTPIHLVSRQVCLFTNVHPRFYNEDFSFFANCTPLALRPTKYIFLQFVPHVFFF